MTHLIPLRRLLFEPGDRLSRDEFLELWRMIRQSSGPKWWMVSSSAPQPDIALRRHE